MDEDLDTAVCDRGPDRPGQGGKTVRGNVRAHDADLLTVPLLRRQEEAKARPAVKHAIADEQIAAFADCHPAELEFAAEAVLGGEEGARGVRAQSDASAQGLRKLAIERPATWHQLDFIHA